MAPWAARSATVVTLWLQLMVLAAGFVPEPMGAGCRCPHTSATSCKCKSHGKGGCHRAGTAPQGSDDGCRMGAACASPQPVFPVVAWLSLPVMERVVLPTPAWELEWLTVTASLERPSRPEAPPPRALG